MDGDITAILKDIENGNSDPGEVLLPLVYNELRDLATAKFARQRPGQTLQATALVHEAYLRLFGSNARPRWENRRHFYGAAALAMKRILINQARKKQRVRHGGAMNRRQLDVLDLADEDTTQTSIPLAKALEELEKDDPQAAEIVNLRYFAGLTIAQTAQAVGLSVRTTNRRWAYAKAWLLMNLDSAT